jgi:phenylacetic acid degradation operon negative regulatory protein
VTISAQQEKEHDERLGHPAALILFALGAAQVPPEPPLPGSALIALLSDLGLSEGAARSAILRMRRGGWLVSYRHGRTVSYAPSERILAGHRRRAGAFTPAGPQWGGSFHALLVSVPESARSFRDEMRRAAQIAGYRTLRAGLLVAPGDRRDEIGDVLDRIPAQASVIPGWLELGSDDTRRVAHDLWSLEELGRRYLTLAGETRAAAATGAGDHQGARAFGAFATATLPVYQAVADDPGLPSELLPPDWPAAELGAALGEALRVFGPPVGAHIDDLRRRATRSATRSASRTGDFS